MRKSTTLGWIEQAEATRVLITAAFDGPATPWRRKLATAALAAWRDRLCAWLTPPHPLGWSASQHQPVRIRAARPHRISDDDDYRRDW
ncbi:MAG TPA: hypothetical protein VME41_08885 [Stellaceae bacterium]|nr:hypothetical protein [Stellaceae bacterium]